MTHQPRSLISDAATKAWEEVYAYKAEIERAEQERIAFRTYPGGSFGPRIRAQIAESIDAFISLSKGEHR